MTPRAQPPKLVEPLAYAGDRPVIRKAYEDGRAYGHWEANDAITWDTTCLGCAAQLNTLAKAQADGEVSGIRFAVAAVETVAARIGTAAAVVMAGLVREELLRASSLGSCFHVRAEDCVTVERPEVADPRYPTDPDARDKIAEHW